MAMSGPLLAHGPLVVVGWAGMTECEKRLLRALQHVLGAPHRLDLTCAFCLEAAAFVALPGYKGDDYFPVTPHFDGVSRRQHSHRFSG